MNWHEGEGRQKSKDKTKQKDEGANRRVRDRKGCKETTKKDKYDAIHPGTHIVEVETLWPKRALSYLIAFMTSRRSWSLSLSSFSHQHMLSRAPSLPGSEKARNGSISSQSTLLFSTAQRSCRCSREWNSNPHIFVLILALLLLSTSLASASTALFFSSTRRKSTQAQSANFNRSLLQLLLPNKQRQERRRTTKNWKKTGRHKREAKKKRKGM